MKRNAQDKLLFCLSFFRGNQPLRTHSRCSKSSRMLQKQEKAVTPRMVEKAYNE